MSGVTVDPKKLTQAADNQHQQAADEAGRAVEATESADLKAKLYETHGPISGPSNDTASAAATVREDAGRAIQNACLTLASGLHAAAARYTSTDSGAGKDLDTQVQG